MQTHLIRFCSHLNRLAEIQKPTPYQLAQNALGQVRESSVLTLVKAKVLSEVYANSPMPAQLADAIAGIIERIVSFNPLKRIQEL